MRNDPFYEEDLLSEQIGKEERKRMEMLKKYANEKNEMYREYVCKKEMEIHKKKCIYQNDNVNKNKCYLSSDVFNVKPIIQQEIKVTNDKKDTLSKDEYLEFKKYLQEQEIQKQKILEQYVSFKQNNGNNSNINNEKSTLKKELAQSQIPDYEYLNKYESQLKEQEHKKQQNQNIQHLLNKSKQEYIHNKHNNITTYSNLTHLFTINPFSKTSPHHFNYISPYELSIIQSKKMKQQQYKQILDNQIQSKTKLHNSNL